MLGSTPFFGLIIFSRKNSRRGPRMEADGQISAAAAHLVGL